MSQELKRVKINGTVGANVVAPGDVVGDPKRVWVQSTAEEYIDSEIEKVKNWVSNTPVTDVSTLTQLPASGDVNTLYRIAGTTSYSEYGWDGTQFVKLDEKEYGIDDEPTAGSENLVKSGGTVQIFGLNFTDWQYNGKFLVDSSNIGQIIAFNNSSSWNSFKIFVAKGNTLCMHQIKRDKSSNYINITNLDGITIEKIEKTGNNGTYSDYEYTASQNCYVVGSSGTKGFCVIKQFEHIDIDNAPVQGSKNPISSDGAYEILKSVQLQGLRLIEVENNLSDKQTYQPIITSTYISNFASVVISEVWKPTYSSNPSFASYKIPVKMGDVVKITPFRSYDPGINEWILFTDMNGIVVAPSELIDNSETVIQLDELSVTALYDGYFHISLSISQNSIVATFTSRNKIFDYIDDVRTITEPIEIGKYINNFSSASIGNVWTPNFTTSENWRVYKIPVRSGDYIIIDKKICFAASIVDKMVFVDLNNVVVEPTYTFSSEDGNKMLYELSYKTLTDGYMYFSTRASNSTVSISSDLTKLYDRVDELSLRISDIESEVKYISDEQIIATAYLDCPVDRQTDIFLDGIIRVEDDVKNKPYKVSGSKDIIQIGDNQLRVTPTSESSNMVLTIYKYDDIEFTRINNSKQMTFRPVSRAVGDGTTIKNICIAGDSLIDGTNAPCEAFRLLNEDGDFIIHQIGTRNATMDGVTYKHEGRGSWSWGTYIDTRYGVYTDPEHPTNPYANRLNAFMIDEDLNFQKYMQMNFPDEVAAGRGIDVFVMSLGSNDVGQGYNIPSDIQITQIINNAKTFINTLLSFDKGYPNCKVIVGLPGVGAKSFVGTNSFSSVFKMAILKLNKAYIDTFDNGKYNANVTCVMHGCYIDRENGYQFEDVDRNDYIGDSELVGYLSTMASDANVPQSVKDAVSYIANNYVSHRKTRRCTNQVHPKQVGYKQWGRGYYGKLRAVVNGLL